MRKSLIVTITAALFLAAVLCTAGLPPEDPVAGTWYCEEEYATRRLDINPDSIRFTAVELADDASPEDSDFITGTFVWTKNSDGTYTGAFDDA